MNIQWYWHFGRTKIITVHCGVMWGTKCKLDELRKELNFIKCICATTTALNQSNKRRHANSTITNCAKLPPGPYPDLSHKSRQHSAERQDDVTRKCPAWFNAISRKAKCSLHHRPNTHLGRKSCRSRVYSVCNKQANHTTNHANIGKPLG